MDRLAILPRAAIDVRLHRLRRAAREDQYGPAGRSRLAGPRLFRHRLRASSMRGSTRATASIGPITGSSTASSSPAASRRSAFIIRELVARKPFLNLRVLVREGPGAHTPLARRFPLHHPVDGLHHPDLSPGGAELSRIAGGRGPALDRSAAASRSCCRSACSCTRVDGRWVLALGALFICIACLMATTLTQRLGNGRLSCRRRSCRRSGIFRADGARRARRESMSPADVLDHRRPVADEPPVRRRDRHSLHADFRARPRAGPFQPDRPACRQPRQPDSRSPCRLSRRRRRSDRAILPWPPLAATSLLGVGRRQAGGRPVLYRWIPGRGRRGVGVLASGRLAAGPVTRQPIAEAGWRRRLPRRGSSARNERRLAVAPVKRSSNNGGPTRLEADAKCEKAYHLGHCEEAGAPFARRKARRSKPDRHRPMPPGLLRRRRRGLQRCSRLLAMTISR